MTGSHPFGTFITFEQLQRQFTALSSWEDRYRQLILLAKQLPPLSTEQKAQCQQISGCENRLWLGYTSLKQGIWHFYGDSDGRISRGLLVVMLVLVEQKTSPQILATDFWLSFEALGITQQLTGTRIAGLRQLIAAVQAIATEL